MARTGVHNLIKTTHPKYLSGYAPGLVRVRLRVRAISHCREYSQVSTCREYSPACENSLQVPFALTRVNSRREIVYASFFVAARTFVGRVT